MKTFNVTVNGTLYEVEIEETTGNAAPAVSAPAPKAAPAAAAAPVKAPAKVAAPAAPTSNASGAIKISAPMPGTILKINVTVGQKISKGDVVCVLEAMKMENDIPASHDGTVVSVNVQKGATVNSGDILITFRYGI